MEEIGALIGGVQAASSPEYLLYCFVGVVVGTLLGVLPGIGPMGGLVLVLPATYAMDPTGALILLAGIYYGSMYGGSTTAILMRIPGEAASAVTCLDGYQMARKGRAGAALAIAAVSSFVAGTLGVVGLMFLSTILASTALMFGPTELFALLLVGLLLAGALSGGSIVKSLVMILLGLVLSLVGTDAFTTAQRFTFGVMELWNGFEIVPVVVGLFAVPEILRAVERAHRKQKVAPVGSLLVSRDELKHSVPPMLRGTVIGFILGILPGAGVILSSFISYSVERRIARDPARFGRGAIEGLAGPEAANNSATSGAFVPLLTLGLPGSAVMAIMLSALLIHGIQPGPRFIFEQSDMFWTFVASMYIGNFMLLILNLPLAPVWAKLLQIPRDLLFSIILIFCVVGVFFVNNSAFDLYVMIGFGVFAYAFEKLGFPMPPMVLAFVLGSQLEFTFRQSLILEDGDFTAVLTAPIPVALFGMAACILTLQFIFHLKSLRSRA